MDDYVPQNDAEFNTWQAGLIAFTEPNLAGWWINADDFTALKASQAVWITAYAKAENKQNRTMPDVQAKVDARAVYEKDLRNFTIQWLANNKRVANSDRERMGLTIKSDTRTPVPKPVTFPVGMADFSVRLQTTLSWADQNTPTSKAKPVGVHGCEIWMKIDGPAPLDPSELSYLATVTHSPYTTTFEGKYVSKTVYFWLRWVNTKGEFGPWSRPISAMVAG